MATLTAKLTLTSADLTSDALSFSETDTLAVLGAISQRRVVLSTTASAIVTAASYTKAYVFVKNLDTAIVIALVKANGGDEYMSLAAGEWAFFPWSTAVDLMADAASGTPALEVLIFQAAA